MFDIGFSEVLLIFVIALVVLGPEKLPRAASQVGRWIGRARAMARQFKDQLEEEVNLENVRKAHKEAAAKEEAAPPKEAAPASAVAPAATEAPAGPIGPDPVDFRADTFSHAHDTNEYGANPHTANGGPPEESQLQPAPAETPMSSVSPTPEVGNPSDPTHLTDETEAYASVTSLAPPLPASEPVREPVANAPTHQSDNHGHS